jgi:hypothetical protein
MMQSFADLVRGLLLMTAISLGGYVYGTPGTQGWAAFFCGVFSVLFVQSLRWFRDDI